MDPIGSRQEAQTRHSSGGPHCLINQRCRTGAELPWQAHQGPSMRWAPSRWQPPLALLQCDLSCARSPAGVPTQSDTLLLVPERQIPVSEVPRGGGKGASKLTAISPAKPQSQWAAVPPRRTERCLGEPPRFPAGHSIQGA